MSERPVAAALRRLGLSEDNLAGLLQMHGDPSPDLPARARRYATARRPPPTLMALLGLLEHLHQTHLINRKDLAELCAPGRTEFIGRLRKSDRALDRVFGRG